MEARCPRTCYFFACLGPVVDLAARLSLPVDLAVLLLVLVDLVVVFATDVVGSRCSVGPFVLDAVAVAPAVSALCFTAGGEIASAISCRPLRIAVTMRGVRVRTV